MKPAALTIVRCATLAIGFAVMMNPIAASADCYSDQQRIINRIQVIMNEMSSGNTGLCRISRQIKAEYPSILDFYNRCPIVDPDGSMRNHIREMLSWADQVETTTCSN